MSRSTRLIRSHQAAEHHAERNANGLDSGATAYKFRFAMDHLRRARPRVVYLALGETDDWAHDGRYDRVLETYARTDGYLRELWTWLQADPEYRGRTHILITTDHGRGHTAKDWRDHGAKVEGAQGRVDCPHLAINRRRGEWRDASAGCTPTRLRQRSPAGWGVDWRRVTAGGWTADSRGTDDAHHVSPQDFSPGAVAKQRQRDVHVAAQRILIAGQVFSHRSSVFHEYRCFGLWKSLLATYGKVLEAGHREEVVAVGGLPHVDQVGQLVAVIPQVAGADLDAPRRAVMRVAGDAQRALPADLAQDVVGRLVGADVAA